MAHFVQLDDNNIVLTVIVINNEDIQDSDGDESEAVGIAFCKSLYGSNTNWAQTSYNENVRYRYASKGMYYDATNNVFRPQQPYPSWTLNTSKWEWEAPVALPSDIGFEDADPPTYFVEYTWDEDTTSWANRTETAVVTLSDPFDPDNNS